jgi:hypothetical protein
MAASKECRGRRIHSGEGDEQPIELLVIERPGRNAIRVEWQILW